MINQSITLLGRSIVDATYSEDLKPGVHDMSFVTLVHSIELFMKAKLLETDKNVIFCSNKTKTININKLPFLLKKILNINIDETYFTKMVKIRNDLMHLGIVNINTAEKTLYYAFNILIPIIEIYYPDDLEKLIESLGYWDDAIFEGYLIEQLDIYNINYSSNIKKRLFFNL